MILKQNKLAQKRFAEFLKTNKSQPAYSSTSQSNSFSCSFYEEGFVYDKVTCRYVSPKRFTTRIDLFNYLKDMGISITEDQKQLIYRESWIYALSPKGSNMLVVTDKYFNLESDAKRITDMMKHKYLPAIVNKG